LKNIVLSFQLLFQQRYLHFSPGESPGGNVRGNVLDPDLDTVIGSCPLSMENCQKNKQRSWQWTIL